MVDVRQPLCFRLCWVSVAEAQDISRREQSRTPEVEHHKASGRAQRPQNDRPNNKDETIWGQAESASSSATVDPVDLVAEPGGLQVLSNRR
ncbi:uncharacterized protein M421DRAFT_422201, partial [Didymella exigua CBS 183.55]